MHQVERRMNRDFLPPTLPIISTGPRPNHRKSQITVMPTVRELYRYSGIIDFQYKYFSEANMLLIAFKFLLFTKLYFVVL